MPRWARCESCISSPEPAPRRGARRGRARARTRLARAHQSGARARPRIRRQRGRRSPAVDPSFRRGLARALARRPGVAPASRARARRHPDRARRPRGGGRGARAPPAAADHRVATHSRLPAAHVAARSSTPVARDRAPHRRRGRAHTRPRGRAPTTRFQRTGVGDPELPRSRSRSSRSIATRRRQRSAPSSTFPTTVGLVGFVGHLIAQKRPDRALDVLVAMHATRRARAPRRRGRRPACATDSSSTSPRAASRDFVHVLGHRDDIPQILAAIDVFILTSDAEGLPGVVIEAQMAGCPIVTVPVGGVRDLVDDGETGIVDRQPRSRRAGGARRRAPARPAPAVPARRARPPARRALLVDTGGRHLRGSARRRRRRA